ncbi:MAG: AAA family ATPase [Bacteroidia bacterium]|nr:AAA family ATPase [Bacteroidia bacterium]
MEKRQVPYTICNFDKLITDNYYYVDKTQYIEKLEKFSCPVFLRPRRFGKSLFTETLKWYYDVKAKDRFDKLFGNLYIGKNPTPRHNSYFFLSLDFSGMSVFASENTKEIQNSFDTKIGTSLWSFLHYYKELLNIDDTFIEHFDREFNKDTSKKLEKVIELVHKASSKLYISIDEYDNLTNALAILYQYAPTEENEYLNILRKGGFFRAFFEAIKDGLKTSVDKVYITGILPITIADMNSGFNVAEWVTFEEELINMLGITESEFNSLLDKIYTENNITVPKQEVQQTIRQYYNGYRFSHSSEYVYNPMMTLFYLKSIINNNKIPNNLTDSNIRVDYNQIAFLFGNNFKKRDEVIETLASDKQIIFSSDINISFDMIDYKNGNYIIEGLLYSGILTHSENNMILKVPNVITYERALSYFERIKNFEIDKKDFGKWIYEYITKGDIEYLMTGFFKEVVQQFPGDFFANVNESFYHGLFFHLVYNNTPKNLFEVLPEYNLSNGQADVMVRSLPKSSDAKGYGRRLSAAPYKINDLFEIKRVPKSASDKELKAKFDQGKTQMQKYRTGEYKDWRGIVVCFRGNMDYMIHVT